MKTGISFSQIQAQSIQQFNQSSLPLNGRVRLTENNVLFVQDAAVEYSVGSRQCSVRPEDLVTVEQFSSAFGEMLSGGPEWVHANLIPFGSNQTGNNQFLITLRAGQKVGNPQLSLNLSSEPNRTAEIISTKTLVTTS